MMFFTPSITFQIGDAAFAGSLYNQSCLTLYLALKIIRCKLSLLEVTIQVSFAKSALLVALAFLKPRVPLPFGRQSLSQAFKARNLPSGAFGFHQNLLEAASRLSQILEGILNIDTTYVGRVWATELIRVHLSTHDRHLLLQPKSRASRRSWRNLKSFNGVLDRRRGAPRYIAS